MTDFPEFILASQSPRRSHLLTKAGYRFRVEPPTLSQRVSLSHALTPTQLAEALAYFKARTVQRRHRDAIVLAADTVVAHGGRVFGKAQDADDARRILGELSGTIHEVITALAMLLPPARPGAGERRLIFADTTHVHMRKLTDEEIQRYIDSGEWRDKAGAYAVQETGDAFIDRIEGSFTNVIGLPMELLARLMATAAAELDAPEA